MTGVKLICAGKLKEDFYLKACREYQKRLSAFCRLEVLEIPEDTRPGGLEREGEKILAAIPPQSYVVAMCIEGEKMSSQELSRKMEKWQNSGISRLPSAGTSMATWANIPKSSTESLSSGNTSAT